MTQRRLGELSRAEAHVSTEAHSAQARAWLPEAHGYPRRAIGPEAPAFAGPQAPDRRLGTLCRSVRREQRLRRSADFAAVYRRGRSYASELLALRVLRTDAPA